MLKYCGRKLFSLANRLEYRKCHPRVFSYNDCFETIRILNSFIKAEYLLDIGANAGNWTYVLHQVNPLLKHAVMFEPQKKYYDKLRTVDLPGVEKIVYPYGLGDHEDQAVIQGGTASASILNATDVQDYYFPGSLNEETEEIEIRVLDKIYAEDYLPYPDVIKLDVQGFELNVLKGARQVLSKAKYLVIELSYEEFYSGQPKLGEIIRFLEENNYSMVAHGHEWRATDNPNHILQTDGIFVNRRFAKP